MAATPARMAPVSIRADNREPAALPWTPVRKNRVIRVNKVGKRPLHGTREFVKIAISLSLGESMIRHPITPAALQPNPMAMVRHCLPQARQRLKERSMWNATRGRYPRSSRRVNRGKKMAMGGSITDTTHARTRYTPYTRAWITGSGILMTESHRARSSSREKKKYFYFK